MARRCRAFVDLESVRASLSPDDGVETLARMVASWGRSHGRLLSASVYGALTPEEARVVRLAGCEGRSTLEDGEGSAPESVHLALDAGELMGGSLADDAILLVTDDAQLAELVRRWRRRGASVHVVVPEPLVVEEPARGADKASSVESFLSGAASFESAVDLVGGACLIRSATVPSPMQDSGDWTKLVLLLRDLETRMPFVGMRWLKNKVLGPHNVGVTSVIERQALLNRAVDEGLIETYRVGNRDELGEPVTACRLVRGNPVVQEILGEREAEVAAPA